MPTPTPHPHFGTYDRYLLTHEAITHWTRFTTPAEVVYLAGPVRECSNPPALHAPVELHIDGDSSARLVGRGVAVDVEGWPAADVVRAFTAAWEVTR